MLKVRLLQELMMLQGKLSDQIEGTCRQKYTFLMKAEKVCGSVFEIYFSMNKIILQSILIIQFQGQTCSILYTGTIFDRTQRKGYRNLHAVAAQIYPLGINKCCAVTCIFLRRFDFCYQNSSQFIDLIKEIQKTPLDFSTVLQYLQ